jgi:transcriptional regulator with XRE-family HTH domain
MDEFISNAELHIRVCKNIKKFRLRAGMSQAELSEKINMSHEYLRQLESDKGQKDFAFYTLYKISLVLNVPIGDFIYDTLPPSRS